MTATDATIRLDVTGPELQLLIDGLLHLEAADVDSLADHDQLHQVHDAQVLAAWLRMRQAMHRRRHLTTAPQPADSSGITAA